MSPKWEPVPNKDMHQTKTYSVTGQSERSRHAIVLHKIELEREMAGTSHMTKVALPDTS